MFLTKTVLNWRYSIRCRKTQIDVGRCGTMWDYGTHGVCPTPGLRRFGKKSMSFPKFPPEIMENVHAKQETPHFFIFLETQRGVAGATKFQPVAAWTEDENPSLLRNPRCATAPPHGRPGLNLLKLGIHLAGELH